MYFNAPTTALDRLKHLTIIDLDLSLDFCRTCLLFCSHFCHQHLGSVLAVELILEIYEDLGYVGSSPCVMDGWFLLLYDSIVRF